MFTYFNYTAQSGSAVQVTLYRDDMTPDEMFAHAAMLSADEGGAPVDVFVGTSLRYDAVTGTHDAPTPIVEPAVRTLSDDRDDAYAWTQTDDTIRDGDILAVDTPHGAVVGFMSGAWPVALHGSEDAIRHTGFHTLTDDADITRLGASHGRGGIYPVAPSAGKDYTASVTGAAAEWFRLNPLPAAADVDAPTDETVTVTLSRADFDVIVNALHEASCSALRRAHAYDDANTTHMANAQRSVSDERHALFTRLMRAGAPIIDGAHRSGMYVVEPLSDDTATPCGWCGYRYTACRCDR